MTGISTTVECERGRVTNLPRCPHTELPRLLCDHCGRTASFTMTDAEIEYLAGQVEPPAPPKPRPHHQIRQIDYPRRRYNPADAPLARDWRTTPTAINCDHGHDDTRHICDTCETHLRQIVADTSRLMADLEVAYTKQVEFLDQGAPIEADPDESPLNWHQAAASVIRDLNAAYLGDPVQRAAHMLSHWADIRRNPDLPKMAAQISEAAVHAHQIIDRPPTLQDYGDCPECGTWIRQERVREDDNDHIICPKGDYSATLKDHQVTQINRGEMRWRSANEILEALKLAGEPMTRTQLQNMIDHEGLPRETLVKLSLGEQQSYEAYRLGDVRAIRRGDARDDGTIPTEQVAVMLGISTAGVRKMVERGQITPKDAGARPLRFDPVQVATAQQKRNTDR